MSEDNPIAPLTVIRLLERIPTRYSAGALLIVTRDLGACVLAHHVHGAPVVRVHKFKIELWTPTPPERRSHAMPSSPRP